MVLAVKKVTAPIFFNLRTCETEKDTSEKHEKKSLDRQEVHQFDLSLFDVSCIRDRKLRMFKINRAVNTFLTASTNYRGYIWVDLSIFRD